MSREAMIATGAGLVAAAILAALIVLGSRNLQHFDAALVAYTFGTLFAFFGLTYRYTMWLQRPPTWMYFKRGWQVFLKPGFIVHNLWVWLKRLTTGFALNTFIWRRSPTRWAGHWLIMWGCIIAAMITFPLVFGWVHFETVGEDFTHYQAYVFGFPIITMEATGVLARFIFHGLIWASFLVLPGVMIAMHRRMRDRDAAAIQRYGEDIVPLLLLFAITVTGLLLWMSYTWMHGYAYDFLAIIHAATVIFTLLWLHFGKFFHIIMRPAQLGVSFYKDVGARGEQAHCRRCGEPFTSRMHVEDLIAVERQLGYRYEMPGGPVEHYQWICPLCCRRLFGLAQGRAFERSEPWAPYVQQDPAT